MTRYFKGPVVLIARLILGGVFIYASLDKIAHPAEFAKAIGNYHVVPFGLENLMALALPWLELIAGIDPGREHKPARPGELRHSALNADKLRALGWKPASTLEQGLHETYTFIVREMAGAGAT